MEVIKEVKEFLPGKAYETVIPRSVKLSEAPSFGKPIWFHDKHSQGAVRYKELATEFLKRNEHLSIQGLEPATLVSQETLCEGITVSRETIEHSQDRNPNGRSEESPQKMESPQGNEVIEYIVSRETIGSVFKVPPEGIIQ